MGDYYVVTVKVDILGEYSIKSKYVTANKQAYYGYSFEITVGSPWAPTSVAYIGNSKGKLS